MSASVSPRPILLAVDDELENLELVERVLAPEWDVCCELDPTRALSLARSRTFTAVLTDFRMPKMDGAQFVYRLHAVDPTLVCLLVTGYGDMQEVRTLKEKRSVCRVILKPWDADDLRNAVNAAAQFTRMRRAVLSLRRT